MARHSRDAVLFSRTARSTSLGSMFGGTATQHAWHQLCTAQNPNRLHGTHQSPFWEGTTALHGATAALQVSDKIFFLCTLPGFSPSTFSITSCSSSPAGLAATQV